MLSFHLIFLDIFVRSTHHAIPHHAVFICHLLPSFFVGPNTSILLSTLFSNTHSLCSFLNIKNEVWCPYIYIYIYIAKLYFCVFYSCLWFKGSKHKDKNSELNGSRFLHGFNFDFLALFSSIWTLPHFKRLHCLSVCYFVRHFVDQTWTYT